ncbi:hypothetical protein HUT16_32130 [Kitasatospora sp. NA04385]|uniref:hypothetical protein n=1 Tax=Kitasatospora sp. NA04385 TaxID=2742135 RepID=UPI001592374F|nr:hypothetical protein [Kitasatospora sp. NA04385]QKW23120.1 hypothetical protein HUT16_32130 [Kitasatospora sp. NA04385]
MTDVESPDTEQSTNAKASRARSAAAAVKGFARKHRKTIAGAGVGLAVIGSAVLREYLNSQLPPGPPHEFDAPEHLPRSDGQRQPVSQHSVQGHFMRISGRPSERAKANYAAALAAGFDGPPEIPPGWTWRDEHDRGSDAA